MKSGKTLLRTIPHVVQQTFIIAFLERNESFDIFRLKKKKKNQYSANHAT